MPVDWNVFCASCSSERSSPNRDQVTWRIQMVKNKELAAFLGHCTGEAFPAASKLAETIRKYPYSEEPHQTGFNTAFETDDPLFTFLTKNPKRFDRFNLGMVGISQGGGRSAKQVGDDYDWASLGEATVVDVGFLAVPVSLITRC